MNKVDELAIRRHLKNIMNYGIPKHVAIEIVETAVEASNGGNVDFYIKYAIAITYGLRFDKRLAVDKR